MDPEVQNIIDKETWRQYSGLELIASEVCGGFAMGDLVFSDNGGEKIEFNFSRNDGGEWFHPDQQVLRGFTQCALLRRQRVD